MAMWREAIVPRHLEIRRESLGSHSRSQARRSASRLGDSARRRQMQITHAAPAGGDNMTAVPGGGNERRKDERAHGESRISSVRGSPARGTPVPPVGAPNPIPPAARTPLVPGESDP